jgi:Domain of unknown function (DUF6429)
MISFRIRSSRALSIFDLGMANSSWTTTKTKSMTWCWPYSGTTFGERQLGQTVLRAWKGHDWDALSRLHEKGFIGDPVGKAKSVFVTEEGASRSEQLFGQFFGK